MSDSHGRFRVKRGELEIEYEGPGFVEEYNAALSYLGILRGAQSRLEDVGFEAIPKQAVERQSASHPPMKLAPLLSGTRGSKVGTEFEKSEFGIESQGHSLKEYGSSPSQGKQAEQTQFLQFNTHSHESRRPEKETEPQSAEPARETNRLFEGKSRDAEGVVPSGKLNDDKFTSVLKKLGLSA
jgi:hypothetical protein